MTASTLPVVGPLPTPASRKVSLSLDGAVLAQGAPQAWEAEVSPSSSGWMSPSERHFNPSGWRNQSVAFQPTTYFELHGVPGTASGTGVAFLAPIVGAPPQASGSTMAEPQQPQQACVQTVGSYQAVGWWAAPTVAAGSAAQPVQPVMAILPGGAPAGAPQPAPVAVASWGFGGHATGPIVNSDYGYGAAARALQPAPMQPEQKPVFTKEQKRDGLGAVNQHGEARWPVSQNQRLPMQSQAPFANGIHTGQVPEAVYVDLSSLREAGRSC
jgi:hypothetical protein